MNNKYIFDTDEIVEELTDEEKKKIVLDLRYEAEYYKNKLLGNKFLIVSDSLDIFEISFGRDRFKHLTGICSNLNAKSFLKLCLGKYKGGRKISKNDIFTTNKHNKHSAYEKRVIFNEIYDLFTNKSYITENITTNSRTYSLGISNLTLTVLCVNESNNYLPASLQKYSCANKANKINSSIMVYQKNINDYSKYRNCLFYSKDRKFTEEEKCKLSEYIEFN